MLGFLQYFLHGLFGAEPEPGHVETAYGRDSIAVDQHQGGYNYPFASTPSDDLNFLIADMDLYYEDPDGLYERPFKISWLYGFGDTSVVYPVGMEHLYDILILDANDVTVFDSRTAAEADVAVVEWTDHLRVVSWALSTARLAVVQFKSWKPGVTPIDFPVYIEPTSAVLDSRVAFHAPPQLTSVTVGSTTIEGKSITFESGYNCDLTVADTEAATASSRQMTAVTIDAAPGGGIGTYPADCDSEVLNITSINGLTSADGNFIMNSTACHRIERPTYDATQDDARDLIVQNHALTISNDCEECCSCQDYINTYEAFRRLRDQIAAISVRLRASRDNYATNLAKFIQSKGCRENKRLRLGLLPECNGKLALVAGYCNTEDRCVTGLVMHISFEYTGAADPAECEVVADSDYTGSTPTVVCNTVFRGGNVVPGSSRMKSAQLYAGNMERYELGGTWPHFWVYWDQVNPGGMATITARFNTSDSLSGDNFDVIADCYETGTPQPINANGSPVPDYEPGVGPAGAALAMRLVDCPEFASAGGGPSGDCCS